MATVANLGQAFYDSLVYFLRNATALDSDFADRFYIVHPTLNLSLLTPPFVLLNPYRDDDEVDVQPDYTGYESRWMTYHFTIQVYCTTYAKERELPELVVNLK